MEGEEKAKSRREKNIRIIIIVKKSISWVESDLISIEPVHSSLLTKVEEEEEI